MRYPFKMNRRGEIDMTPYEKMIIRNFACGNLALRDKAIAIHRKYVPLLGSHGKSLYQDFMSEIDNPCPDLMLRNRYREQLVSQNYDIVPMTDIDMLESVCKNTKRWGLYISIYVPADIPIGESIDEVLKAALFLNPVDHGQVIADGRGWFFFDTEDEMNDAFWMCVGDNGPTGDVNPYDGPVRVYAITCDTNGITMNENT